MFLFIFLYTSGFLRLAYTKYDAKVVNKTLISTGSDYF